MDSLRLVRAASFVGPHRQKEHKHPKFGNLPLSTSGPQSCALTGIALLQSPYLNKGSAFTARERKEFKLEGFLPANVRTLDEQVKGAYEQYSSLPDDLAKNTFMTSMHEQNEVLFYKLIQTYLREMFSVIYTPTEGDAIQNFSRLFRRPEGCFLNINSPDEVHDNLAQWGKPDDIDYIVVTDSEEILGIGDQGVGGILISVAKLVLATLCAGVHPNRTLPVVLDCGTDNRELLNNELYLGLRQPRIRGERYDAFVDTFVTSARKLYPRTFIHFEDFGLTNARRIIDKYSPHIPCFNDDIQGTGCVTLAAIYSALYVSKVELADVRVIIFGAGTAGTGIADQLRDAIATEAGRSKEEAARQIWCVDKPGLLLQSHGLALTTAQKPFARASSEFDGPPPQDLLSTVRAVKPHVLVGTSTKPKAFSEDIVREMASHVDRPIILPLSNPTRLHEAVPEDLYAWTDGKALVATGSPFPPFTYNNRTYNIAECNNSTCFPGIGLACILSRASLLTPRMLAAAAMALASQSPVLEDPHNPLLPDVEDVRYFSICIAKRVVRQAVEEGVAQEKGIPGGERELEEWMREQMWDARYRELVRVEREDARAEAKGELGYKGRRTSSR